MVALAQAKNFHDKADVYLKDARSDDAINALRKGLEINPTSSDNYFGLALIYQESGADKSAVEAFLEAIKIDPGNLEASIELLVRRDRDREGEATLARELRGALRTRPPDPRPLSGDRRAPQE